MTTEVHELAERLGHHRQRFTMMHDELLPARKVAVESVQKRVNFMFDDVFDLLAAKQEELADWQKAVVALRRASVPKRATCRCIPPTAGRCRTG